MAVPLLKTGFIDDGRSGKRLSVLLAIVTVVAMVTLYYQQNAFLEAFEAKSYDLRFKTVRGVRPPADDIVIIAIDDKSIAELGRYPWSRTRYVQLLDRLKDARTRAVVFDVFFPEPESPAADNALGSAIARTGNVIMAELYQLDREFQVQALLQSLPQITDGAMATGHINFVPDNDGVNRRNLLVIDSGEALTPSLGLAAAMALLGESQFEASDFRLHVGERTIPVDQRRAMWINYGGPGGHYPYFSFTDVIHGRIDLQQLRQKLVFVGATAPGIYDMRVTPFDGNVPGVEVHATVADNIVSGNFIRQGGVEALIDLVAIVVLTLLVYFLTMRLVLYAAIPVSVLLLAAYIWIAGKLFAGGHWISIVYPTIAVIAALLVGGGFRFLVLERRARVMRAMFSHYVSPKLVARLEQDPEAARIGGDNRTVTILFSDIKGFTSFSEGRSPQDVVKKLNEYLDAMVQVIMGFDGTVDKFMGDAIMAYWGAPLEQKDHAPRAVAAALAMRTRLAQLNAQWRERGLEPFHVRVGLNSGDVVAGNIGSRGRKMEYTVIGDNVNLASRLEGAAAEYGVDVLVAESTYGLTRERFQFRQLDQLRVAGKLVDVKVYQLLDPASPLVGPLSDRFEMLLTLYRARKWSEAGEGFAALSEQLPDDVPTQIYIERCRRFAEQPPSEGWTGVFDVRKK